MKRYDDGGDISAADNGGGGGFDLGNISNELGGGDFTINPADFKKINFGDLGLGSSDAPMAPCEISSLYPKPGSTFSGGF